MDGVQVESFVYHSTTCLNEANASVHDDDRSWKWLYNHIQLPKFIKLHTYNFILRKVYLSKMIFLITRVSESLKKKEKNVLELEQCVPCCKIIPRKYTQKFYNI